MRRLFLPILAFAVLLTGCSPADAPPAVTEETAAPAPAAAVAMPDSYSAQVAEDVLRAGGNAVDAAVAVGFSLAVTYPEAGNIGGGGFMLIHMNGEDSFLDYRETAPLAAHTDMYLDEDGNVIDGQSLIGHLAVGVPGTVAGMWEAHKRFGTLPWKDLVTPAVTLAADGFVVPEALGGGMMSLGDWYGRDTNFEDYFGAMVVGEVFRQPELAATLARIAEHGPEDFYRGETADLLVAEMERGGGLITHEDLDRYTPVWREPLKSKWRDFEIVAAPPPSSGGFAVVQLLKMRDHLDHLFEDQPHNSPNYIHLVAEMEKRVFADRAKYLGDPDYVDNRMDELLADEYIAERAREVNPHVISNLDAVGPGLESPDTTHYSIVDADGNAVANTYTLNLSFGSRVVVEGAGFLLNDEMDDFSAKPGVKNAYGVVGFAANEIQPGKRMLSSMSPTLLKKDGQVHMLLGTPGGTTIFTSVYQAIVNILDYRMTPEQATGATRFHHQLMPPTVITYSPGRPLPDETISALGDIGYTAIPHSWEFGDLQVIWRDGGEWRPASDPRNRGESWVIRADDAAAEPGS